MFLGSCQKGRPGPGLHPCPETSQAGCLALAPPSPPLRVNLDFGFTGPRELQVPFPGDKHTLVNRFFPEGRESEQSPNFTTWFPQQRAATAHSPDIPGGGGRRERSATGEGMNWLQVIRTLAWSTDLKDPTVCCLSRCYYITWAHTVQYSSPQPSGHGAFEMCTPNGVQVEMSKLTCAKGLNRHWTSKT